MWSADGTRFRISVRTIDLGAAYFDPNESVTRAAYNYVASPG